MKTKYSQLLKVKKQRVDFVENEIARLNFKKSQVENEISSIENEISSIKKPQNGRFGEFLTVSFSFDKLIALKKQKMSSLEYLQTELINKQNEYKYELKEYEKIKYLEDLIIKEKLAKMKKDEQKLLDELSVITYKRRTF